MSLRRLIVWPVMLAGLLAVAGCTSYRDRSVDMTTQAIDPTAYAGLWYEVARFPVIFQRGCTAVTAEYGVVDGETLSVINSCRDGSPDGPQRQIEGFATVEGPGKLRVRLDGVPVGAPYWVLWVDEDYQTAVVGTPSGRAGWVLSKTPEIDSDHWEFARQVLSSNGYDLSELTLTPR